MRRNLVALYLYLELFAFLSRRGRSAPPPARGPANLAGGRARLQLLELRAGACRLMDSRQTVRCSSCFSERTWTAPEGQTIRVTHRCPGHWERIR